MIEVPLQTIDNFLRQFHVGHLLVLGLVLSILAALPLKSAKVLAINVILFGTIFLLVPIPLTGDSSFYRLFGIGLIIVGPMLYFSANS